MTKIKFKSGKTLEYTNGQRYYDGKPRSAKNFTIIDKDGYTKGITEDGNFFVKDVDKNGNANKHEYIGSNIKIPKKGTPGRQKIIDKVNVETSNKYWESNPIIRHATDSIAKRYNLSGNLLRNRLDKEGFTQMSIRKNNKGEDVSSYNALNTNYEYEYADGTKASPGFIAFGLDDVATMIKNNQVHLINEKWTDSFNKNEHGRIVNTADGITNKDNIGIMAATLKYFYDVAKKDMPGASRKTLEEAANIYYNRGIEGGRRYINKHGTTKYNK